MVYHAFVARPCELALEQEGTEAAHSECDRYTVDTYWV